MKIYISSPYTIGDAGHNIRAQIHAAEYIRSIGHIPYVPLLTHLWHLISPHEHDYWLEMDEVWVATCDALVRLPGESKGADREVQLARDLGKQVYMSLSAIPVADVDFA